MSRHRTATIEPEAGEPGFQPSPAPRKGPSFSGAARNTGPLPGSRSARKKKGVFRRTGIVLPAIGIAAVVVALVTVVTYAMSGSGNGSGAAAFTGGLNALTHSGSISALESERQQLIVMNAAASTLSEGAKPATVNPHAVIAASESAAASASAAASQSAAADNSGSSDSSDSGSSSSSGSDSGTTVNVPPASTPDPGSAEAIAQELMPSYGFSVSGQYSCLYDLWMRESGWRYDAYNPSGAYGIPQSLPGSKMASAGSDWETNPATQIKWGLGYISGVYGTPCGAWDHEEADGWY
ncbi:MAG TPA: hypothetical protein VH478_08205 [Trebonia sp.]|nr:hypothetical protein [Trebonia sp.]